MPKGYLDKSDWGEEDDKEEGEASDKPLTTEQLQDNIQEIIAALDEARQLLFENFANKERLQKLRKGVRSQVGMVYPAADRCVEEAIGILEDLDEMLGKLA